MEKPLLNYLTQAFSCVSEPMCIAELKGEVILANSAFKRFLGLNTEDQSHLAISDFWPGYASSIGTDEVVVTEFRRTDGESLSVQLRVSLVGKDVFLILVMRALSKSGLHNFHNQRMETLGLLAGGVAHDFNNILTGILGHITYLKTILPPQGAHVESLNAVEEGARKASSITREILTFSRVDAGKKAERTNLCDVISRTFLLLRGAIAPRYNMHVNLPDEPVWIILEESKMSQVIVNLVINSRDAIKNEGNIEISLDVVEDETLIKEVFHTNEPLSRRYARLTVMDNGEGMSREVLKRMFEPYFSTKKDLGTGLGLSTVDAIVKLFGGVIFVSSEEGNGTTVCVYLPLLADQTLSTQPGSRKQKSALKGGDERILIVDDEYPVRNVLSVSLEHLGYSVIPASGGEEALALFKSSSEKFDLVILDMLMPHLSGEEVFAELKHLDPDVRVLIISGYTTEDSIQNVLNNGGRGFIQKPFTIEDLSRKVRACLD